MIKFTVITPKKDAIAKSVIEAMKKQINDKLKEVICPLHHQRAQIIISGPINNLKFEIKGCCQTLTDEAKKALG